LPVTGLTNATAASAVGGAARPAGSAAVSPAAAVRSTARGARTRTAAATVARGDDFTLIVSRNGKLVTVPWDAARFNHGKRIATIDLSADQFDRIPTYTSDRYPDFYTPAYRNQVKLDFIRPGRPVENGLIESFNGRLRDECLNLHLFWSVEDAHAKLETWREDYNTERPHSALANLPPAAFAASAMRKEKQHETRELLLAEN